MQENLLLIKAALNLTAGAEVDVYIRSKKLVKGVDIVMNVVEAISLLKKYNLYEDAEAECNRLKITKAPYDMQGFHNVYCDFLSKQSVKINNQIRALRNIKCLEWENVEDDSRPVHADCSFAYISLEKNYCKTKCVYYREQIAPLEQELEELVQAEKELKEAAQRDFCMR